MVQGSMFQVPGSRIKLAACEKIFIFFNLLNKLASEAKLTNFEP